MYEDTKTVVSEVFIGMFFGSRETPDTHDALYHRDEWVKQQLKTAHAKDVNTSKAILHFGETPCKNGDGIAYSVVIEYTIPAGG